MTLQRRYVFFSRAVKVVIVVTNGIGKLSYEFFVKCRALFSINFFTYLFQT